MSRQKKLITPTPVTAATTNNNDNNNDDDDDNSNDPYCLRVDYDQCVVR
jgi:hypothetical protein